MNKSKLEDEIFYGDHAQSLVTNPAYQAAMTRMKARLFDQFGSTGFFERRKREELWKMKRLLESFEQEIETMISDAALAKNDLEQERKFKTV